MANFQRHFPFPSCSQLRTLNRNVLHEKVSGTQTYCILCSGVKRRTKNGPKTLRKGSRQVQWCSTCRQAICCSCRTVWHSRPTLKRHGPSPVHEREFDSGRRTFQRIRQASQARE
ncbi:unnamed protein product [Chondrus crispus]|uniref:Uncharacterized protein n=1 Tax=Chondrus crispus TaxID=2769 RepID=R7Q640_CHOCR|nr:unnamed protein product [Chondrus crispus]CDF32935.1 unnamed protein product [Chondrus crispus]|eukprot:XP_005712738.1 unnamed protein product [Chondrus crispus]